MLSKYLFRKEMLIMNQNKKIASQNNLTTVPVSQDKYSVIVGLTETVRKSGGVEFSHQHLIGHGLRTQVKHLENAIRTGELKMLPIARVSSVCDIDGKFRFETDRKFDIKVEDYHLIERIRELTNEFRGTWVSSGEQGSFSFNLDEELSDEDIILGVFLFMYEAGIIVDSQEFTTTIKARGKRIVPGDIDINVSVFIMHPGEYRETLVYGRVYSVVSKEYAYRISDPDGRNPEQVYEHSDQDLSYDELDGPVR
jgi:hypothetical protein